MATPTAERPVSHNTIAINQQMTRFDGHAEVWLFGYGSLIYKADFAWLERRPASIRHWVRRFWQGSHDHRGTPDAPGRVVTLIAQPDAVCAGMAYLITLDTLDHLDVREKNGYLRFATELSLDDGRRAEGLVYIATAEKRCVPRAGARARDRPAYRPLGRAERPEQRLLAAARPRPARDAGRRSARVRDRARAGRQHDAKRGA